MWHFNYCFTSVLNEINVEILFGCKLLHFYGKIIAYSVKANTHLNKTI